MSQIKAIKKRKLGIEGMVCDGCEGTIETEVGKLKGVRTVKADYKAKELNIEYDLMDITLKDIEQKVIDLGYKLPSGRSKKIKRGWIHYTEQNERYNHFAGSCSCDVAGSCYMGEKK